MSNYSGFKIGDKVTYHGSLEKYHPYVFHIAELFEWGGIDCCKLTGPRFTIWIERCRVMNIQPYDGPFDYYHDREYDDAYFDNTVWITPSPELLERLNEGGGLQHE